MACTAVDSHEKTWPGVDFADILVSTHKSGTQVRVPRVWEFLEIWQPEVGRGRNAAAIQRWLGIPCNADRRSFRSGPCWRLSSRIFCKKKNHEFLIWPQRGSKSYERQILSSFTRRDCCSLTGQERMMIIVTISLKIREHVIRKRKFNREIQVL